MMMRLVCAAALGSGLLSGAAVAQAVPPSGSIAPRAPAAAPETSFAPGPTATAPVRFLARREPGVLRATDLIGQEVYSPRNEDLGNVDNVLIGRDGRVVAFVLEVGGFLGLGERKVAVPPSAIHLDPLGMTATTGTVKSEGLPPSTMTGAATRANNRTSPVVVPDRLVLTVPIDQLRSAPAYLDEE